MKRSVFGARGCLEGYVERGKGSNTLRGGRVREVKGCDADIGGAGTQARQNNYLGIHSTSAVRPTPFRISTGYQPYEQAHDQQEGGSHVSTPWMACRMSHTLPGPFHPARPFLPHQPFCPTKAFLPHQGLFATSPARAARADLLLCEEPHDCHRLERIRLASGEGTCAAGALRGHALLQQEEPGEEP